ncbi:MAG: 2-C-methyl-D-erythritol 2,4-cyclodiphosphate synthase [Spirochaetales bacterium]|uniref:2-C-methyl-D-erythritol 2,4-cyclodiphosphate synthase n=1 Tax=Candidatus Thalassospirochaeta sargassi TaxID=3119039 RepID=A0AAJ1ML03_9SPIO|nr:2-C-methyl-D-erythritol 2,4-cyclodiphosphate synthase [Spirochaetales bacterium]
MRIGQGWDVHRMEPGLKLIIGGTLIESQYGPVAHSDGDVLAHAIIDAVLGAAAASDIGSHFPDTSAQWKDSDSLKLLKHAVDTAAAAGLRLVNIDSTVILQKPKLRPYIDSMRERIAAAAGLAPGAVSVKAKTAEGIGELGAGRAVEAIAVVLTEEY